MNPFHGTITPSGNYSVKAKDSIDIEFRMNSAYTFKRFEVLDKSTSQVLSDAIEFSEIKESETLSGNTYKVTAKILTENSNLLIQPVCGLKNDTKAPEFVGNFYFARSEEDFENGNLLNTEVTVTDSNYLALNDYNHVSDVIYFKFDVKEEDSTVSKIKIFETDYRNTESLEYSVESFTVTEKSGGICSVCFEYKIKSATDQFYNISLSLIDEGENESELKTVFVLKDTEVSSNFYLCNHPVKETLNSGESIYTYSCTTDLIEYQIPENESYTMDLTLTATLDSCWGTVFTTPDKMTWNYCFSTDKTLLDSLETTPIYFSESGSEYTYNLSIPITEKNKTVYIKIIAEDEVGNKKIGIYQVPAIPKLISKRYKIRGGSPKYKTLYVTMNDVDEEDKFNNILFAHNVNNKDTKWHARMGSPTQVMEENVTYYYSSSNYESSWFTGYTDFYIQQAYCYKDFVGTERYIYGKVSDKYIANQDSGVTLDVELSPEISIEKGEQNIHTITVTVTDDQKKYYDEFFVRKSSYFFHRFNAEENSISFDINTADFYGSDGLTRIDYAFEVVAIKDDFEYSYDYTISSSDTRILDNVPPVVSGLSDSLPRDYTNGYLVVSGIKDIGNGMANYLAPKITYKKDDYESVRTSFWDSSTDLLIPISHLPSYGNYEISFSLKDSSDNIGNYSFTYCFPGSTAGFIYHDKAYGYNNNTGTKYSFRVNAPSNYLPSDYSYINVSIDSIKSSETEWSNFKTNMSVARYEKYGYFYVYTPGFDTSANAFFRIFLTKSDKYEGPLYYYQQGVQTVTVKDLMNGTYGVQIYSDKPFFVHTLWNEIDYKDDVEAWEQHCITGTNLNPNITKQELVPKCISDPYATSPYYYSIPLSEIPVGVYYAVIVHYADGTSVISSVRQK